MRMFVFSILSLMFVGCGTTQIDVKMADKVEIDKFMGDWYVLAGRFTFLETDVHNGLERYTFNQEKDRIDVDFTYNKGSFTGPKKSVPQKAWVENKTTNSHWKVSPIWPLKLDYLILAVDKNYRWAAIGVPNQKYLWIMARDWRTPEPTVAEVVKVLDEQGYDTKNLIRVPHQW